MTSSNGILPNAMNAAEAFFGRVHPAADITPAVLRKLSLFRDECKRGWNKKDFEVRYVHNRKLPSSRPPYRDGNVHAVFSLDSDRKVIRYVEKRGRENLERASLAAMNEFGVLQEVVFFPFRRIPKTYVSFYFPAVGVPDLNRNDMQFLIRVTCRRRGRFENGVFQIEARPRPIPLRGEEQKLELLFSCGERGSGGELMGELEWAVMKILKISVHTTFNKFRLDGIRKNEVLLLRFEVGMKFRDPGNRARSFVRHFVASLSVMNDTGGEMEGNANYKYPNLPLDVATTREGRTVTSSDQDRLKRFMQGIKLRGGGKQREEGRGESHEGENHISHIDILPYVEALNLKNVSTFGSLLVDDVDEVRKRVFAHSSSESSSSPPSLVSGLVDSVDDIRERVFRCQKIATACDPYSHLQSHQFARSLHRTVETLVRQVRGLRDSLDAVHPCSRTKDMSLELDLLDAQLNALQPGEATLMEEEEGEGCGLKLVVVPTIARVKVAPVGDQNIGKSLTLNSLVLLDCPLFWSRVSCFGNQSELKEFLKTTPLKSSLQTQKGEGVTHDVAVTRWIPMQPHPTIPKTYQCTVRVEIRLARRERLQKLDVAVESVQEHFSFLRNSGNCPAFAKLVVDPWEALADEESMQIDDDGEEEKERTGIDVDGGRGYVTLVAFEQVIDLSVDEEESGEEETMMDVDDGEQLPLGCSHPIPIFFEYRDVVNLKNALSGASKCLVAVVDQFSVFPPALGILDQCTFGGPFEGLHFCHDGYHFALDVSDLPGMNDSNRGRMAADRASASDVVLVLHSEREYNRKVSKLIQCVVLSAMACAPIPQFVFVENNSQKSGLLPPSHPDYYKNIAESFSKKMKDRLEFAGATSELHERSGRGDRVGRTSEFKHFPRLAGPQRVQVADFVRREGQSAVFGMLHHSNAGSLLKEIHDKVITAHARVWVRELKTIRDVKLQKIRILLLRVAESWAAKKRDSAKRSRGATDLISRLFALEQAGLERLDVLFHEVNTTSSGQQVLRMADGLFLERVFTDLLKSSVAERVDDSLMGVCFDAETPDLYSSLKKDDFVETLWMDAIELGYEHLVRSLIDRLDDSYLQFAFALQCLAVRVPSNLQSELSSVRALALNPEAFGQCFEKIRAVYEQRFVVLREFFSDYGGVLDDCSEEEWQYGVDLESELPRGLPLSDVLALFSEFEEKKRSIIDFFIGFLTVGSHARAEFRRHRKADFIAMVAGNSELLQPLLADSLDNPVPAILNVVRVFFERFLPSFQCTITWDLRERSFRRVVTYFEEFAVFSRQQIDAFLKPKDEQQRVEAARAERLLVNSLKVAKFEAKKTENVVGRTRLWEYPLVLTSEPARTFVQHLGGVVGADLEENHVTQHNLISYLKRCSLTTTDDPETPVIRISGLKDGHSPPRLDVRMSKQVADSIRQYFADFEKDSDEWRRYMFEKNTAFFPQPPQVVKPRTIMMPPCLVPSRGYADVIFRGALNIRRFAEDLRQFGGVQEQDVSPDSTPAVQDSIPAAKSLVFLVISESELEAYCTQLVQQSQNDVATFEVSWTMANKAPSSFLLPSDCHIMIPVIIDNLVGKVGEVAAHYSLAQLLIPLLELKLDTRIDCCLMMDQRLTDMTLLDLNCRYKSAVFPLGVKFSQMVLEYELQMSRSEINLEKLMHQLAFKGYFLSRQSMSNRDAHANLAKLRLLQKERPENPRKKKWLEKVQKAFVPFNLSHCNRNTFVTRQLDEMGDDIETAMNDVVEVYEGMLKDTFDDRICCLAFKRMGSDAVSDIWAGRRPKTHYRRTRSARGGLVLFRTRFLREYLFVETIADLFPMETMPKKEDWARHSLGIYSSKKPGGLMFRMNQDGRLGLQLFTCQVAIKGRRGKSSVVRSPRRSARLSKQQTAEDGDATMDLGSGEAGEREGTWGTVSLDQVVDLVEFPASVPARGLKRKREVVEEGDSKGRRPKKRRKKMIPVDDVNLKDETDDEEEDESMDVDG